MLSGVKLGLKRFSGGSHHFIWIPVRHNSHRGVHHFLWEQTIFFSGGGGGVRRSVNFSKPFLCFLFMFEKRYQICHMPVPYAVLYVIIRWYILVNIFLINSVNKLYFLPTFPTFSTIFFLRFLWRQPFFNISSSSHLQV